MGKAVVTGVEVFVLAEVFYYCLSDGDETLHGAFVAWCGRKRDDAAHYFGIAHTRYMIRKLPER